MSLLLVHIVSPPLRSASSNAIDLTSDNIPRGGTRQATLAIGHGHVILSDSPPIELPKDTIENAIRAFKPPHGWRVVSKPQPITLESLAVVLTRLGSTITVLL
jgi:hypothetical protein